MTRLLPSHPSLDQLKHQAKDLLKAYHRGDMDVCGTLRRLPRFGKAPDQEIMSAGVSLQEMQHALALEYGFPSWKELKKRVMETARKKEDPLLSGTRKAHPHDFYESWNPPSDPDAFQTNLVLSVCPKGTRIREVTSMLPHYRYPLRIRVELPDGQERPLLLKMDEKIGGVEMEAKLLPVLSRLGLPVAKVLTDPVVCPDYPTAGPMIVETMVAGEFVPFWKATAKELDLVCRLILEGAGRLRDLTDRLTREKVSKDLPRQTLLSELKGIINRGGPWFQEKIFIQAVERLLPVLRDIRTPLVFSNGNNIPFNYLHVDGKLSGFFDLSRACFEDPHIQFAKYKIWAFDTVGWGPFSQAGLVERYLYSQNVSQSEFAPRLALQCLYQLQRDASVPDNEHVGQRENILNVLEEALSRL